MTVAYRALVAAVRLASPVLARGESKLARGVRGRRDAHRELVAWGVARGPAKMPRTDGPVAAEPAADRPVAWLHAPSVGECRRAAAVIERLRAGVPGVRVALTYFSPSAERVAATFGADVTAYLPWDLRAPIGHVLDALRPSIVAFTQTEVWPTLVEEAHWRGIPVGIVAATVPDRAGRASWPGRVLLRPSWRRLTFAGAVGERDAERLGSLGVPETAISVTGDPGVDAAARRLDELDPNAPWLRSLGGSTSPTIVAGSTWPADEAVLLPALAAVRDAIPDVRVIVAPHEPEPAHVQALARSLARAGWPVSRLGEIEAGPDEVRDGAVIVDRVGVLAELYATGTVAFVGGGFGRDGVHSVLEPAAAGLPVAFGPHYRRSDAACALLEEGGARLAANSDDLARILVQWLRDEAELRATGDVAARYIERHTGAAARTARLLVPMLAKSP